MTTAHIVSDGRSDGNAPHRAPRGVIDRIATGSGGVIMFLGILQLVGPGPLRLLIGMGSEVGAYIVAAQWAVFGFLLMTGGAFTIRPLATYAAEFLLLSSSCAIVILFLVEAGALSIGMQIIIAILATASSSTMRMADRVQAKREFRYIRAQSAPINNDQTAPNEGTTIGE